MDVNAVLGDAALVVCVGPGGVGKTSVAASLGIAAARAGRRVCVLTVDPARRLAAALGVGLGDHPSRVPITAAGELWAAMLDAPASLAAMIDRVAPDPEFKRRMLADPMYRAGAGALSRSHAYAAMEWLHDVFEREAFDLVVLDTPPAAVGVEMFDAPGRLLALLDPKVFGWLLEPRKPGLAGRVLAGGGALVRRGAEAVMGEGPWSSLVDFLGLLARLQPGFVVRSAAMAARMRRADTRFVLVSRPDALALADLDQIAAALVERQLPIAAAVWNRVPVDVDDPAPLDPAAAAEFLGALDERAIAVLSAAREARRGAARERTQARARAHAFAGRLGIPRSFEVPEFESMADLDDLLRIATALAEPA
jgi:anion-transporting  ArsA/GET3 family ATPase